MSLDHSTIFFSLLKILEKSGLSQDKFPTNVEQWQDFLIKINNSFYDFEQERYLLERSLEISSREMLEMNERYENAQSIAHIGYWYYDPIKDKTLWSQEAYKIFGLDPAMPPPNYANIMRLVVEEDRIDLDTKIKNSINTGSDYEHEFRIINQHNKQMHWCYIKINATSKQKYNDTILYSQAGIIMDISQRKEYESKVKELNTQLIAYARAAGMSEIATSVLHNIGNILNSANISVSLIQETLKNSELKSLKVTSDMLIENLPKNPQYLISDDKGKLIPRFLLSLSTQLETEYNCINNESINLIKNLSHIQDIVVMQKDISGVSGIREKISLEHLCDLSFEMSQIDFYGKGIEIHKSYEFAPMLIVDKTKLLQILVNVIRNAKEALAMSNSHSPKYINLTVKKSANADFFEILIHDTGIGISKEYLTKIFSMGFTTKKSGHGFGLHSSAIAAMELGGSLVAVSDGPGLGATFILKLPMKVVAQ